MARSSARRSAFDPSGHGLNRLLRPRQPEATITTWNPPIEHRDVTTIMALLGNIDENVRAIRGLLEDENGEEEAPEDDT
jgi:hypothetical protein